MSEVTISAAFVAGVLIFLAPCTFPLVPAYLGFISGVSANDLKDPKLAPIARKRIILNGLAFISGFSLVLIIVLGTLAFSIGELIGEYRFLASRIGGVFIIAFGLMMVGILKIPFIKSDLRVKIPRFIEVGKPSSSFLIGSIFALGWSPCIGPSLGAILDLAAIAETAPKAILLLFVFSLGLALPFMIIAVGFSSVTRHIAKISKYLSIISVIGGIGFIIIGILIVTNNLGLLVQYGYKIFDFIGYERLQDRL